MDEDWVWPEFPVVLGFGSTHEMRDNEPSVRKSRLWDLKSTSKAACLAYDKHQAQPKARKVGFAARKPR